MCNEVLCGKLLKIKKQFLCGVSINNIALQEFLKDISWDDQEVLLKNTVNSPLVQKFPINTSYQTVFLKKVIQILEDNCVEVHDDLYDAFCNILNKNDSEKYFYKHYIVEDVTVSLKENKNFISEGTTGLCSWQASLALTQWCLNNKTLLNNTAILELGSGVGLLGLTVAQLCGPKEIYLTDCHKEVLKVLEENVQLNLKLSSKNNSSVISDNRSGIDNSGNGSGIGSAGANSDIDFSISVTDNSVKDNSNELNELSKVKINVLDLDWETVHLNNYCAQLEPSIILAADVVYDQTVFEPLCNTVKHFLDRNVNLKVIFACTERNPDTLQQFLNLLESRSLKITNLKTPEPKDLFWSTEVPIKLFLVTAP